MKLKNIKLKNYAGYRSALFDFSNRPISVLYGPNGCGKSTLLNAINLISSAKRYEGRENDLLFRKITYHPDYDPSLPHFAKYQNEMEIIAEFDDGKIVEVNSDGVKRNDLTVFSGSVYIDADHPINMKKFQLCEDRSDLFIELAKSVYGYPASLSKEVVTYEENWDGKKSTYAEFEKDNKDNIMFYQDFIIDKGDSKVHFKTMSDGERKIATLLRNLCDPSVMSRGDIILVDNIEMHIYWKRHANLVDKLLECFPEKQFIVTTHSGVLINHVKEKYGDNCLFDVSEIKGQPLVA